MLPSKAGLVRGGFGVKLFYLYIYTHIYTYDTNNKTTALRRNEMRIGLTVDLLMSIPRA